MSRPSNILLRAINYDHTLVLAVELSNKSWVLAAQVPGLPQTKAQRTIEPNKNALLAAIDGYRARAAAVGYTVDRVITTYEAGWSGFWLARWLVTLERDEVAAAEAPDRAGKMIQQLTSLRGIGVQSATVLVREAFVRNFSNGKALGSYAGLTSTPYSSGGIEGDVPLSVEILEAVVAH